MTTTSAAKKSTTAEGYKTTALAADELRKMHAYWLALNYLSVGQIALFLS